MLRNKIERFVLWMYKTFHLNDDWCVTVRDYKTNEVIEAFATPWCSKALWKWKILHFKYPEDNIILSHYRYPDRYPEV